MVVISLQNEYKYVVEGSCDDAQGCELEEHENGESSLQRVTFIFFHKITYMFINYQAKNIFRWGTKFTGEIVIAGILEVGNSLHY